MIRTAVRCALTTRLPLRAAGPIASASPAIARAAPCAARLPRRALRATQPPYVLRSVATSLTRAMASDAGSTQPPAEVAAGEKQLVEKFRKDYAPLPYLIESVKLSFDLRDESSEVEASLTVVPKGASAAAAEAGEEVAPFDVSLDGGKSLRPTLVEIDGKSVPEGPEGWEARSGGGLVLRSGAIARLASGGPSRPFKLTTVVTIKPQENTELEGLYRSNGTFCTQCEAEGFRNITFFPDRPDVMATFTVRVEADRASVPVLLSNGNLVQSGEVADVGTQPGEAGDEHSPRHFAVWEDPYPKPCYLFALVAGDLVASGDSFVTKSGREVQLNVWTAAKDVGLTRFALDSLKRAMAWDEERFGLEYDLDLFNIVAVDDFNMGAMENKGLNVFNSRLVLSSPESASDADHGRIEGVVGHEYFHNWTGNRVTCRDWFQLTLKEGLTVYRDQEFSSDLNSRPVKRIEDVQRLRAAQFPEDSGPMAHPIRPESYVKMDNFYTSTVYEKGAEVVRIYEALLGRDGFRKGIDLYFRRHDGSAVTCDDFRAAMADANGVDLSRLEGWYRQAGTPKLTLTVSFDPAADGGTLVLTAAQETTPTPGQPTKEPLLVPIRVGLLHPRTGAEISLVLDGKDLGTETVLELDSRSATYAFTGVGDARPVLSPLRGFSAPVRLETPDATPEDLAVLLAHDRDEYVRWDAGQTLVRRLLVSLYNAAGDAAAPGSAASHPPPTAEEATAAVESSRLAEAFRSVLADPESDGAFKAYALSLPSPAELHPDLPGVDPTRLHAVVRSVERALAASLRPDLERAVRDADAALEGKAYEFTPTDVAARAVRARALAYLATLAGDGGSAIVPELERRLASATNMSDEVGALVALDKTGDAGAIERALGGFYDKWRDSQLVLFKWMSLKAGSNAAENTPKVRDLLGHEAVKLSNPNTCYSLFLAFARSPVNFHAADGSGYEFIADAVLRLDGINKQVASRVVGALSHWRDVDPARAALMRAQLERIVAQDGVSDNVLEIASKALKD